MFKTPPSIIHYFIIKTLFLLIYSSGAAGLEVSSEEFQIIDQFETLRESDPVGAEKFLNESLQTTRTSPLLYQAALVEVNHNRINKAVDYFSEILKIDDTFPGAYMNRGRLYAMNGDPELAISDLMKGVNSEGADSETMSILNQVYHQLDQPIAAELILRWSLLSKPTDANLHVQLALNLLQQGRYKEAEIVAENAIHLGAMDANPWIIAVNALIAQDNTEKALVILESARLLLAEFPPDLLSTLGDLYLQQGLSEEAAQVFLEAHQHQSLDSKRMEMLLESFLALEDGENAVKFAKILRNGDPESAQVMFFSAQAAQLSDDLEGALDYVEQATKLDSGFGKAFLLLGDLHLQLENPDDALNALRIARSFNDLQIEALRLELEHWLQQENWPEALTILETLSQIDPDHSWDGLIGSVLDLIRQQE